MKVPTPKRNQWPWNTIPWLIWNKKEELEKYRAAEKTGLPVGYIQIEKGSYRCHFDLVYAYKNHQALIFLPDDLVAIRAHIEDIFKNKKPHRAYTIGNTGPSLVSISHLSLTEARDTMELLHGLWKLRYGPQANMFQEAIRELNKEFPLQEKKNMVKLYKNAGDFAVVTDCQDEDDFRSGFSEALDELITKGQFDGDWSFQLQGWLKRYVDICCKYRGYKTDVQERRLIAAGGFWSETLNPLSSDNRTSLQAANGLDSKEHYES